MSLFQKYILDFAWCSPCPLSVYFALWSSFPHISACYCYILIRVCVCVCVCVCVPASVCGRVCQARRWQGAGRGPWTWLLGCALPVTESEGDIARPWLPQLGQSGVSARAFRHVQRPVTDPLMDSNVFSTVSAALCWSPVCVFVQIMKVTVCFNEISAHSFAAPLLIEDYSESRGWTPRGSWKL